MLQIRILFGLSIHIISSYALANSVIEVCTPQVIKKIDNWDIIASNTGDISTSQAFKGKNLIFSLEAHPHNKVNKVTIDSHNGKIKIHADARDEFDVVVKATNKCGHVLTTFNVVIDEEE